MRLAIVNIKKKRTFTEVVDPLLIEWIEPNEIAMRKDGHVVVPMLGRMTKLREQLQDVPPEILGAVRNGRLRLILDNSLESHQPSNEILSAWYSAFNEFEIPPARVCHLTQSSNFDEIYSTWCQRKEVSERIEVHFYHYFHKLFANKISAAGMAEWASKRSRFVASLQRPRSRKFVSLNFKIRPMRLRFLLSIIRDGFWDAGIVSFGGIVQEDILNATIGRQRQDPIASFRKQSGAEELLPYLDILLSKGEVVVGANVDRAHNGRITSSWLVLDQDDAMYQDSYFTAVTETEMGARDKRITEKMLKPLANFHPIIAFANYRSLRKVRELGFHTFSKVIDEDYDEIQDPLKRFDAAYREFSRLVSMSESNLHGWYSLIFPVLEENSRRMYMDFHPHLVESMDKVLVARLNKWTTE